MSWITNESFYAKPVNRWQYRLPYHLMLPSIPEFFDDDYMTEVLNHCHADPNEHRNYFMEPSNQFKEWAIISGITQYEIIFWADLTEWQYRLALGANDNLHYRSYPISVGFAEEKHLIFYKLRWM
jgi:hypothetical protein